MVRTVKKSSPIPLHGSLAGRPDDQDPRPGRCHGTAHCSEVDRGPSHDGRSAVDLFDGLEAGNILLADRAYDSNALCEWLAERGVWGNIRAMPNHLKEPVFSHYLYKQRNAVERFFNKLKHFRAVATRYDKRDDNFLASVQLASLRIWLRFNESVA
jgi:transposase